MSTPRAATNKKLLQRSMVLGHRVLPSWLLTAVKK